MNRIQHTLCAALVTLLALLNCPAAKSATPSVRLDVNWPQFMARQDLVWDKLPEHWYDAAYMGNGMLGLMIYKEPNANYLRFEPGNCALHDHRPGSNDLFHACRLLTGHFELHPQGTIVGGRMRLDLWNAETTADIETTAGHIRLRAYVHSDRMIILTQLSTTEGEAGCHWRWVPAPSESPRYLFAKNGGNWIKVPDNYPLNPAPQVDSTQTKGTSVQNYWAGGTSAVAWRETQRGDGRTLWVTLANSYPATDALVTTGNVSQFYEMPAMEVIGELEALARDGNSGGWEGCINPDGSCVMENNGMFCANHISGYSRRSCADF